MISNNNTVVIIGAGPAGLTAAYELATKSDKHIIVIEADTQVGGISKTVDYKGNKIDIGGHRFFSKSDWVLQWWQQFLPIVTQDVEFNTTYHQQQKVLRVTKVDDPSKPHMMLRSRKSRIYYNRHLFDYPLKLNLQTIRGIGLWKNLKIMASLIHSRMYPIKEEKNLEDFYINRFGYELYLTFFKDYTYKVWGKPCREISAEWGRQRVKGLSLRKIIQHCLTALFYPQRNRFGNKKVEQTLTEYFLYPQQGPGQLWEKVARSCRLENVEIRLQQKVVGMTVEDNRVTGVTVRDLQSSSEYFIQSSYVISTMPVKHLVLGLGKYVPESIFDIASRLEYRDFLIVGLLLDEMVVEKKYGKSLDDNWLYIQDGEVKVGRVQLFHNWSPHMTADKSKCWIGAEYFCKKGDDLWTMPNEELIRFASEELASIGLIDTSKVIDGTVVRMPKAYPSYVGSYQDFDLVKVFLNTIKNLYLIGRNGTHKYNNQDHSMLTALEAVTNILSQDSSKDNIWNVNVEQEYHEQIKE